MPNLIQFSPSPHPKSTPPAPFSAKNCFWAFLSLRDDFTSEICEKGKKLDVKTHTHTHTQAHQNNRIISTVRIRERDRERETCVVWHALLSQNYNDKKKKNPSQKLKKSFTNDYVWKTLTQIAAFAI